MGYSKAILVGNTLELYIYENNIIQKRKSRKVRRGKRIKTLNFRNDHIRRKKSQFLRIIRCNLVGEENPAFVSLTMFEIVSIGQAYRDFTVCMSRLRASYGQHFKYVAVPEFQKRGAVHFHMLVWGLSKELIQNERLSRNIQHHWQKGFVDCLITDGSPKLSSYIGKYLSKTLMDKRLLGKKAYVCSRNLDRPTILPFAEAVGYSKDIWDVDLSTAVPIAEKEINVQWMGKGRYKIYKLN